MKDYCATVSYYIVYLLRSERWTDLSVWVKVTEVRQKMANVHCSWSDRDIILGAAAGNKPEPAGTARPVGS